jgi:hypothetical protein
MVWVRRATALTGRTVAASALAAVIVALVATQVAVLTRTTREEATTLRAYGRMISRLQAAGLQPPCVVGGPQAPLVAVSTRCAARMDTGFDSMGTPIALRHAARRARVAVLDGRGGRRERWARLGWQPIVFRTGRIHLTAYLSPPARDSAPTAP